MKIIKQGKLPEDRDRRATCQHCSTEVEFKQREVKRFAYPYDPREPVDGYNYVVCPLCHKHIVLNG